MQIRKLVCDELEFNLFHNFIRRQVVTECYRKVDGQWRIKSDPFIDEWSEEEYCFLIRCLKNTIQTGGVVYGAFEHGALKGFCSVEAGLFGTNLDYLDLSCIHVSQEMRGNGIGRKLFQMACTWAKQHGAKKLYISAHSAVETQKFYLAMGCYDAKEQKKEHVEREPYDRQMECIII